MPQSLLSVINIVVTDCRVRRNTIIPQTDRGIVPFDPDLDILALRDMLEKQLEQGVRLFFFEADNSFSEAGIYEERFLASCLGL